ncbi:MAG TPA: hypothetical protein VN791_07205 [Acidimicrobiales bacterium]|nr:hypothetical protein [Acidimicrobiales bacterium]
MRRNKRTLIAAIGVGALVLAGSAAFTQSLLFSSQANVNRIGYGTVNTTGATVDNINYTYEDSATGSQIDTVTFTTVQDTTTRYDASVGFTLDDAGATLTATTYCTAAADTSSPADGGATTWTCNNSGATGGIAQQIADYTPVGGSLVLGIQATDIVVAQTS